MRLLHLHSSFGTGGKELRAAKLMNAFGKGVTHTVVSAVPDAMGAAAAIDRQIPVAYPKDFPPLAGLLRPGRLQRIAQAMKGFDLILTYNWGAMDAVMAHTLFRDLHGLPPLVHHEDGFNEDEAVQRKRSRNWYRRIGLGRASALVVPSQRLETIALSEWHQPEGRVVRIANGIDTAAYAKKPKPDALPRVIKRPGEKWLGTLAGLRAVKNLPRLVRAFADLPDEWQLVILGEGPEREVIRAEALRLNVAHRVHLPGFVADPAKAVGLFDLFALSSDSEQFPISVVEAMAAGLSVVSTDVGDVAGMLVEDNRVFVTPVGDEPALAASLTRLASDEALRRGIGEANRARARAEYDEKAMVATYRGVYARALGRASFP
ncbi:glycosyltransferase family 4 protein [Novosphingobium sp. JCM 18896]|uniref:glycosyltransferase family 4 protein n=1 Tax=Novosphingobium sp. JCM 18896 TaxID=2989731 RepID=UPI0022231C06|nr:glycosyltransferase family 4 protein [Novosphingobium sp. JCM 18896]MCW1430451.1 glycosyltransferase family 4 protein [Novosphingobium sp. JCM 18896]